MSVAEAQERISSAEFTEWIAFYRREPFAAERIEKMIAILCATTANFSGNTKRKLRDEDFLPKYGPARKESADEIKSKLGLFTNMMKAFAQKKRARIEKRNNKKAGR